MTRSQYGGCGLKQKNAKKMNVEENDEWEEEEQLVLVELSGVINNDVLYKCDPTKCRLLGVDQEEPVLQISHCNFIGQYKDAIGTHIIFEETGAEGSKKLKYKCHTTKTLEMMRAFLKKKEVVDSTCNTEGHLKEPSA